MDNNETPAPLPQYPQAVPQPQPKKDRKVLKGIGIGILIIVLILVVGYYGLNYYNNFSQEIYEDGINYGMEYALVSILTEAVKCQQIPIDYQNETYNLFLVECLNQGVDNG